MMFAVASVLAAFAAAKTCAPLGKYAGEIQLDGIPVSYSVDFAKQGTLDAYIHADNILLGDCSLTLDGSKWEVKGGVVSVDNSPVVCKQDGMCGDIDLCEHREGMMVASYSCKGDDLEAGGKYEGTVLKKQSSIEKMAAACSPVGSYKAVVEDAQSDTVYGLDVKEDHTASVYLALDVPKLDMKGCRVDVGGLKWSLLGSSVAVSESKLTCVSNDKCGFDMCDADIASHFADVTFKCAKDSLVLNDSGHKIVFKK